MIGLLKAVVENDLVNAELVKSANDYVGAIKERVDGISWTDIEAQTGLTPVMFKDAVISFANANRAVVLVGQGVLRTQGGYGTMVNVLDLLLLTGKLDRPGCGVGPAC